MCVCVTVPVSKPNSWLPGEPGRPECGGGCRAGAGSGRCCGERRQRCSRERSGTQRSVPCSSVPGEAGKRRAFPGDLSVRQAPGPASVRSGSFGQTRYATESAPGLRSCLAWGGFGGWSCVSLLEKLKGCFLSSSPFHTPCQGSKPLVPFSETT